MSVSDRVRQLLTPPPSSAVERPRITWPAWLLGPGLVLFVASLLGYLYLLYRQPITGLDLGMVRGGLDAFANGDPVYLGGYTELALPYTYPPITLIILQPFHWFGQVGALRLMVVLGFIGLFLILWATSRMLGHRTSAGQWGLIGAIAAVAVWTEPYQSLFSMGQVNMLFIMVPVVVDLMLPDRNRYKGIGIGIAAACKLLPGLFIVYLVLTRRVRAAIVASATFVVMLGLGFLVSPGGFKDYWLEGRAFDTHRVLMTLGPRFVGNQSLQGFTARVFGTDSQNTAVWMISVLITLVAGLALAVWAQRRGEEALGMIIVGFTALLISPVSWSHYWLWIAPLALVLVDVARRTIAARPTGWPPAVASGLVIAALVPFLTWLVPPPPGGPVVPSGLIWSAEYGWMGFWQRDAYVPTALLLLVAAALWLRARDRTPELAGPSPTPAASEPNASEPSTTSREPASDDRVGATP